MGILTRQGGIWKDSTPFAKHAGLWKPASEAYAKDAGLWKQTYRASNPAFLLSGTFASDADGWTLTDSMSWQSTSSRTAPGVIRAVDGGAVYVLPRSLAAGLRIGAQVWGRSSALAFRYLYLSLDGSTWIKSHTERNSGSTYLKQLVEMSAAADSDVYIGVSADASSTGISYFDDWQIWGAPDVDLGAPMEGGYYAGMIQQDDGLYMLIVAPKSAEGVRAWGPDGLTGANSTYDGKYNSSLLDNQIYLAAMHCLAYRGAGFSDWYLPSRYEFTAIYRNLKPTTTSNTGTAGENPYGVPSSDSRYTDTDPAQTSVADFRAGGSQAFEASGYWTSTETSSNHAWSIGFTSGAETTGTSYINRASELLVRPVRKIKI